MESTVQLERRTVNKHSALKLVTDVYERVEEQFPTKGALFVSSAIFNSLCLAVKQPEKLTVNTIDAYFEIRYMYGIFFDVIIEDDRLREDYYYFSNYKGLDMLGYEGLSSHISKYMYEQVSRLRPQITNSSTDLEIFTISR
ncbi:MAG: hypothetical protein AAF378_18195 [Cyanobacteria bacterium P01_A01_bin.84]